MMTLFGTATSPFVRKVKVAAQLAGLPVQFEQVETNPVKPNEGYARSNPLMRVPALRLEDGTLLADSKLICDYFDRLKPGVLLPLREEDRLQVQAIHYLSDGALDSAVSIRYETAVRPPELRWQGWIDGQQAKIHHALEFLNNQVLWVQRQKLYLDQIAVVCLLDYLVFRNIVPNWQQQFPLLESLRARLSEFPEFRATAPA